MGHLDAVSFCAIGALVLQSAALVFFAGSLWRSNSEHERRLDGHGEAISKLTEVLFELKGRSEKK